MISNTTHYDLSVIIASYNVKGLTRQCIQSVIDSTQNISYEIIVVDDNSPDGSAEMVREEFPQVELIVNKINQYYTGANNIGLKASKGRYGLLLNCDTVVNDGAFETLVRFMDATPDAAACGPKLLNPDGSTQHCVRGFPGPLVMAAQAINLHNIWPNNPITEKYYYLNIDQNRPQPVPSIGTTAFVIRREIWDGEVGLLDPRFPQLMADQAYCLMLQKAKKQIYYVPMAEVMHYGSQSLNQDSRKAIRKLHDELRLFYDVFYAPKQNILQRWMMRGGIRARRLLKLLENRLRRDKRLITGPGAPQSKA
jgi:GT2 family glycosyltransferase